MTDDILRFFQNADAEWRALVMDVAIFTEYRNRGLARWLKAAMIEKIRRDRAEVTRVRTDNAHSNAAMLRINEEMGFRALKAWNIWQVGVSQAQAYVAERGYGRLEIDD